MQGTFEALKFTYIMAGAMLGQIKIVLEGGRVIITETFDSTDVNKFNALASEYKAKDGDGGLEEANDARKQHIEQLDRAVDTRLRQAIAENGGAWAFGDSGGGEAFITQAQLDRRDLDHGATFNDGEGKLMTAVNTALLSDDARQALLLDGSFANDDDVPAYTTMPGAVTQPLTEASRAPDQRADSDGCIDLEPVAMSDDPAEAPTVKQKDVSAAIAAAELTNTGSTSEAPRAP